MATDSASSTGNAAIVSAAASSSGADDCFEEGCSICLEPFSAEDPATVTNCKHEYHLHCILEWSQRSKECPMCWQLVILKDPACQELLVAAADSERSLCPKLYVQHGDRSLEIDHDHMYSYDSDYDEHLLQQFSGMSSRAHYFDRRRRQTSSAIGLSQVFPSVAAAAASPHAQIDASPVPNDYDNSDASDEPRQPPHDSGRRTSSSELLSLPDSFKSKLSAASARYKESISKGTLSFKEKLIARNGSVKELSKGVQREMNAGIAGVQRMFKRLDLTSKGAGVSVSSSNCTEEPSSLSQKEMGVKEDVINQPFPGDSGTKTRHRHSDVPRCGCNTTTGKLKAFLMQGKN